MDLNIIAGLSKTTNYSGGESAASGIKGNVPKIIQPSFGAGELSTSLAGRVDMAKYRVGLAICENFMVLPGGGVTNRPGLQFVSALPGPARLIPFQFSATQGFELVFLDKLMMVSFNGGIVQHPSQLLPASGTPFSYGGDYFEGITTYTGGKADFAFDGDLTTYWRSALTSDAANGAAAIGLDLGTPTIISSVQLQQGTGVVGNVVNAQTQIASTKLQNSPDGVTWTDVQVMVWTPTDLNTLHNQTIAVTAPVSARYWRLLQNESDTAPSDGNGGWAVRELSFLSPSFNSVVATGTPLAYGGVFAYTNDALAFDGDPTTYWRSPLVGGKANDVAAIGLDLGVAQTISSVQLQQGTGVVGNVVNAQTQIAKTKLQSSPDNVTWTDVQAVVWAPTDLNTLHDQTIAITTLVSARYWRLLQDQSISTPKDNLGGWAVRELSFIYNTPATVVVPGTPLSAGGDESTTTTTVSYTDIPDFAFDGDLTTYWRSALTSDAANGAAAIGLDLGTPTIISSVQLQQGTGVVGNVVNAQTQIASTKLQNSPDGVTWTDVQVMVWTPTDLNTLHNQTIAVTAPVSARYWRLLQNESDTAPSDGNGGWAVRELSFLSQVVGPVEVPSPYAIADVPDISYAQSADVLFLTHTSYPSMKLIRYSDYQWEFVPLSFVSAIPIPQGITAVYNNGNPKGFSKTNPSETVQYTVTSLDANGNESLPAAPVSIAVDCFWYSGATVLIQWTPVPSAVSYKVYKNTRGFFGLIGNVTGTSQTATLTPGKVLSSSDGPGKPAANAFDGNVSTHWSSGERGASSINGISYLGVDVGVATVVAQIRLNQGTSNNPYSICSEVDIQYSNDGLTWTTLASWALPKAVASWQNYYVTNASVSARYWRLLAHTSDSASSGVVGSSSAINSTAAARWSVNELEFHGTGDNTTFTDDNINEDAGQGTLTDQNPFDGPGNYPGTVGIFQQRLWFARTNNNPQTLWASRTGLFESMAVSYPIQSDDALQFTLDSRQVNEIRYLLPMRSLLIFTSGGEWAMTGANGLDAVTPTSVSNKIQGYRGCAMGLPPIPVGRDVLFVQRNASVVREMEYNLYVDLYTADNVSVLADHMFLRHTLTQWAYAQDPFSIVWAVRDDGVLLGFTYMKEQDVWAWHRHITDGWFRSVCTVDEGNGRDEVYFVIERGVGNFTLEKFYPRNILPQPFVVEIT